MKQLMSENQKKAKDFLMVIRNYYKTIVQKQEKVEALRMALTGSAIRYDKDNVQTSASNFNEKILADMIDLEAEIQEDIAQVDEAMTNAYIIIDKLTNKKEQNILLYYYINNCSYDETANYVHMSRRSTCRTEMEALEHFGEYL